MSGPRFFASRIASLTTALLCLSAAPAFAEGGRGNPGGGRSGIPGGGYRGGVSVGIGYRGVSVGVGYRGGYSGGYNPGYYSGGYRSAYYGRYTGGYAPGYFSSVGVRYAPTYTVPAYLSAYTPPSYAYPSPATGYANPNPGDVGLPQPQEPPPPPDGAAAVSVVVPADAEVFFNGDPTKQKGEQREFVTPTLPVGRAYQYEIHARWNANGQVVDQTRTIIIHSNELANVDFTRAEPLAPPTPAPPQPK